MASFCWLLIWGTLAGLASVLDGTVGQGLNNGAPNGLQLSNDQQEFTFKSNSLRLSVPGGPTFVLPPGFQLPPELMAQLQAQQASGQGGGQQGPGNGSPPSNGPPGNGGGPPPNGGGPSGSGGGPPPNGGGPSGNGGGPVGPGNGPSSGGSGPSGSGPPQGPPHSNGPQNDPSSPPDSDYYPDDGPEGPPPPPKHHSKRKPTHHSNPQGVPEGAAYKQTVVAAYQGWGSGSSGRQGGGVDYFHSNDY